MALWGKKKEKESKGSKVSPTDEARLATYARTRAVQENEILGHHYWEMHKKTDTNLWQINRVEITEELDEENQSRTDIFRTVKAQYHHLNFFDAIKQMADFENYLTVSTAQYTNETIEELGNEHYIHVAEQEGFIVFDAKSKRPVYAPNGKIPENGKFRESDLQRAFELAAVTKEKHPEVFKKDATDINNVSSSNSKTDVSVQPMSVPSGVDVLSNMVNVAHVSDDTKIIFEQIKEMDQLITDLKICRDATREGIREPYSRVKSSRTNNYMSPFEYVREAYGEAKGKTQSIKCADSELKQNIMTFFQKMELSIYIVEAQSWHHYSKIKPEYVEKYQGKIEKALAQAIFISEKLGVTNITLASLQLTLGEEEPKMPVAIENFIESYETWREKQLKAVKNNQTVSEKIAIPPIRLHKF